MVELVTTSAFNIPDALLADNTSDGFLLLYQANATVTDFQAGYPRHHCTAAIRS